MASPDAISGPTPRQAMAAFALAGLAAYFNSFQGDFVFDDFGMIVDPDIGRPLAGQLAGRPVVSLTFTLNFWLDGYHTRGYHLANLAIHVLAAATLFDLMRRTLVLPRFAGRYAGSSGWIAFVVALLWLVHPLNTQSVTYLVQRCESLMGLLVLLSLRCYLRGVQTGRMRWHWLGGLSCVLASGCKELTIAVPFLAALYDRMFLADSWRETAARWKPIAILAIGPLLGIGLLFARGVLADEGGAVGFAIARYTPVTYALTQTEVIPHYLRLSIWPKDLCLDYIDWPVRTTLQSVWPSALGTVVALAISAWGLWRNRPWAFLSAWFFAILAPTSSIVPIQDPAFEHRMYLPLIAVIAGFVFAAEVGLQRMRPTVRVSIAILLTLGLFASLTARTILRNGDYESEMKLVAAAVALRPENARCRKIYAEHLLEKGFPNEALEQALIARERPDIVGDLTVLANCYLELGRTDEAEQTMRAFVESRPKDGRRNSALGRILLHNGKPAEAEAFARTALLAISDIRTRLVLAIGLEEQEKLDAANAMYAEAERLAPEGFRHSIRTSARRTAIDPDATPFLLRQAYYDALSAVRMNPADDGEEWDTYAIVLARLGRFPEAVTAGERALAAARSRTDDERSRLANRVELFRAGKPFLQPGSAP